METFNICNPIKWKIILPVLYSHFQAGFSTKDQCDLKSIRTKNYSLTCRSQVKEFLSIYKIPFKISYYLYIFNISFIIVDTVQGEKMLLFSKSLVAFTESSKARQKQRVFNIMVCLERPETKINICIRDMLIILYYWLYNFPTNKTKAIYHISGPLP